MWVTRERTLGTIDTIGDLISLSKMIASSKQSKIIVILPQNNRFTYNTRESDCGYWKRREFKDALRDFHYVLGHVFQPLERIDLIYENTNNFSWQQKSIGFISFWWECEACADEVREKSNKPTTVEVGEKILSTLNISNCNEVQDFCH